MHSKELIPAIDISNTHVEIGLFDNVTFIGSWHIATGVYRKEDEVIMNKDYRRNQMVQR